MSENDNKTGTEKYRVRTSVRKIVEFVLRCGSIDRRISEKSEIDAMLKGAKIHRKIQSQAGAGYKSEVPLKHEFDMGDHIIFTEGRADGVICEDGSYTVDEIKTLFSDPEELDEPKYVHLSQAMFYAYFILCDNALENISVRMTYVNYDTEEKKFFNYDYTAEDIKEKVFCIIEQYDKWVVMEHEHLNLRNETIRELSFPYPFRTGQERIVKAVYNSVKNRRNLYLEAPTGSGKTLGVMYPAIHAMGEERCSRIFYLTARNVAARAAVEASAILTGKGLILNSVHILSRNNACMLSEPQCDPVSCKYADGFFDRINDILFHMLTNEKSFDRDVIFRYAEEYKLCPYYLILELTRFMDLIVCDYNYVFDPDVRLSSFFDDGGENFIFLVDESHNMVSRSRDMYSASILKEDVLASRRLFKERNRKVYLALGRLNKVLLELRKNTEKITVLNSIACITDPLEHVMFEFDRFLEKEEDAVFRSEVLEYYFVFRSFLNAYARSDERYVYYCEADGKDLLVKILCVDPSEDIKNSIACGVSTVFFSATLRPLEYYKRLTGAADSDYEYQAPSPFPPGNKKIFIGADVSSRYKRRNESEFRKIASYISKMALSRKGNYLVFFPSHKMLQDVLKVYKEEFDCDDINWAVQSRMMLDDDREIFLENFEENAKRSFIGFSVMGGIFSEGIDLPGDRLIGVAVIGTGIPQISGETDILRTKYEEMDLNGFDYALKYPGMNKVMQSAGRLIRTETDTGMILLLDDRFLNRDYRNLFRNDWADPEVVVLDDFDIRAEDFWNSIRK